MSSFLSLQTLTLKLAKKFSPHAFSKRFYIVNIPKKWSSWLRYHTIFEVLSSWPHYFFLIRSIITDIEAHENKKGRKGLGVFESRNETYQLKPHCFSYDHTKNMAFFNRLGLFYQISHKTPTVILHLTHSCSRLSRGGMMDMTKARTGTLPRQTRGSEAIGHRFGCPTHPAISR